MKIYACLFFMLFGTVLLRSRKMDGCDMLKALERLSEQLRGAASVQAKIALLDACPDVMDYLLQHPDLHTQLVDSSLEAESVCKQLIAIGQMDRLIGEGPFESRSFRELLEKMMAVDAFYKELGGIVGYQKKVMECLEESPSSKQAEIAAFYPPDFIDIQQETEEVLEAVAIAIRCLPQMVEMYPLGGAADRLHLVDEKTGQELPAAKLAYGGRTLLEGLIRDLQAREFLYFKLYGVQVDIPTAIMTSQEKDNHQHVLKICEEHRWFGRRKELFRFFTQPLVPAVDPQGNWCLAGPFAPLLKPGGHGALWKLARDTGVFQWFEKLSRKKALIRQINNPIASLDYGLLAFTGLGVQKQCVFGFASCQRVVKSAEGVNVIVEKKNGELALTNIEYCDFAKYGIEDVPLNDQEPYSRFSSNTNILFADLKAIERAVEACPFPGLLINLKQISSSGSSKKPGFMARLESTMQNIADVFAEKKKPNATFVTYNHRHKTIATTKKAYLAGGPTQETPEECFYIQLQAARELAERCGISIPSPRSLQDYLIYGPEIVFLYHPALGPFYSLIAQKIKGGKMAVGSELQLEIADLELTKLQIEGSLVVLASQPLGHFDEQGVLRYSDRTGRCILTNVRVKNAGVDWQESAPYWKNHFVRREALEIYLHGFSEFIAENICFHGAHRFHVPEGVRMRVSQENGHLIVREEPLEEGSCWIYRWEERQGVLAARKNNEK